MHAYTRNIAVLVVLLGLALATWLVGRPPVSEEVTATTEAVQLGYYLKNAVLLGTDADGRIYYRIFAGQVEQSSGAEELLLSKVRVEYEPDSDVNWKFSAERGTAAPDRDYIELQDGVQLTSETEVEGSLTTIETQSLRLNTRESEASTDEHVTLMHGKTRFEAESLRADLTRDYFELTQVVARTHE
jgi:LPS export ABC transporter protein LptC